MTDVLLQWTSLCLTTGIEGFYIAIQGSINNLSAPKLFFSDKAKKFLKALALKFKSWVVSGMDLPTVSNHQRPLNKLVSQCRTHLQDKLGT
ncbi:hypothetical protein JVU11DRAFT_6545 [Chiua virens]|nr:hypothetical protein JVU11DRAFT_6545 [Chiua virens]